MTTAATQLEIAAQYLQEAAIMLVGKGGKNDSMQFKRVAEDCLKVVKEANR